MNNWKRFLSAVLSAALLCGAAPGAIAQENDPCWRVGFARRQIKLPENSSEPLYISGYNSGWEITGLLDLCEARAVWLDAGEGGVLLLGKAQEVLDKEFPELAKKIKLHIPDESSRRVGQSVAAASLPNA